MKKKNKHLKEKSKRFKEYKKKRSYINLKNDIKSLPREIQMMIYIMTISAANSDNFNYHKFKFYKTLKQFNINFENEDQYQIKKMDGSWYKIDVNEVKYYSNNNICEKIVDTDQTKLLEIKCNNQQMYYAIDHYILPSCRNYEGTGTFWFHEKCRCKKCDQVKLYALKYEKKIYKKDKYEYDLYRDDELMYTISDIKYYHMEYKSIYPIYKKKYKGLPFTWIKSYWI